MALNVDLSKPLDEETIADLRARLPLGQVDRLIELAEASETPEADDSGDSAGEDGDGPFDPSVHGVREVREYLLTATPEETERVLDAERAGKARRGLLDD